MTVFCLSNILKQMDNLFTHLRFGCYLPYGFDIVKVGKNISEVSLWVNLLVQLNLAVSV